MSQCHVTKMYAYVFYFIVVSPFITHTHMKIPREIDHLVDTASKIHVNTHKEFQSKIKWAHTIIVYCEERVVDILFFQLNRICLLYIYIFYYKA
jgi:hypothetical protein